jgi:predicted enzyme related to lactoylglutathione lyase
VWFECVTSDVARAKGFYGEVFGWKVQAHPMGETSYEMIAVGEKPVGGYTKTENGSPPHWTSYLSVADVDATLATARAAGARVLVPAFDVPEVGRMAKLADPQGATFWIMRGTGDDAADAPTVPGSFTWNELWARDASEELAFYERVFGYSHKDVEMPNGVYHVLERDGAMRGGIMKSPDAKVPPMWLPYVHVDDCDATAARAKKLGAEIHVPPTDIPGVGRFTVLSDPLGATIAALKPAS